MIYVFLAQGFEEIEAITTVDILRRAKYDVRTVATSEGKVVGAHGIPVLADCTEQDVFPELMDAIVLPGGMPGVENLKSSSVVEGCIRYCNHRNKVIAAICAAPSILGLYGILKGRHAVCYPGFEKELVGATLSDMTVCRDGNIVTARDAGCTIEFSFSIIEALGGKCALHDARTIFS